MRISDWSSDVCSSDLVVPTEEGADVVHLDLPAEEDQQHEDEIGNTTDNRRVYAFGAASQPGARQLRAGGDKSENQSDSQRDEGDRQGDHRTFQHKRNVFDELVEAFHAACQCPSIKRNATAGSAAVALVQSGVKGQPQLP